MGLYSWVKEGGWSPMPERGGLDLNPRNKGEGWGMYLEVRGRRREGWPLLLSLLACVLASRDLHTAGPAGL